MRYRKWREQADGKLWWISFFKVFIVQGFLLWLISAPPARRAIQSITCATYRFGLAGRVSMAGGVSL